MRVLALNPYHGGSHQQFLSQWEQTSEHDFTILHLPPRHFKWRIRQGAYGLAQQANELASAGRRFDQLLTTSMLDAAELRGFLCPRLRNLPLTVLFHENQFVYPKRKSDERDVQFALINWASALAADSVWFNSKYNRSTFLEGAERLLRKMPDERSLDSVETIRSKSRVAYLGIEAPRISGQKSPGPLHLAWVGRWEHDKRPDIFLAALRLLKAQGVVFQLTCLGQSFRAIPDEFRQLERLFSSELVTLGYQPAREQYMHCLSQADAVVTTADHEFFGLALLEAVAQGCVPVAPRHLVYPELYPDSCLFDGSPESLASHLFELSKKKSAAEYRTLEATHAERGLPQLAAQFYWGVRGPELDRLLAQTSLANVAD